MSSWVGLIASAVPSVLAIGARFLSDGRDENQVRRIRRYTDLLGEVPDEAKDPLKTLIRSEVQLFATNQARRSSRTLDGGTVFALLFIGVITALLVWGSSYLALNVHGAFWALTALVGAFGMIFMGIGVGQLYKYPVSSPAQNA